MKKRLLGALVLVILAIIFVPMLLPDHSGNGTQSVSVKIPPQPNGDMQTRVLQVGPGGASAGSSTAAAVNDSDHVATLNVPNRKPPEVEPVSAGQPTAAAVAAATSTVVTPPAASQITQTLPPKPVPAPIPSAVAKQAAPVASASAKAAPSATARPLPGGAGAAAGALYIVNLGIYADHASANKLVANAKQHGFAALASPETFQGKSVSRVTVGPFRSRAEAEAARLKLASFDRVSMSIESTVVNQRGDAPTSALPTAQPGGWAVQLAAFATQDAANGLRDRLRQQGFDGYVDSITTAKGKLWRVRAGPFASRDAAIAARGQIAQKLKISGDVVTQH